MKAAVYCGTRNLYNDMVTAAKSLICNSNVDRIYFLIEDDKFPEKLPPIIETINVSNQQYFPHDGVNFNNQWTFMVLMKLALHDMFPNLDKVLVMDVDTVVVDDVSDLWDIDLNNCCIAGAREPLKSDGSRLYVNAGVMMMNLRLLRRMGKGNELIAVVNRKKFLFCEQDCIAERCQGLIKEIPGDYNACCVTESSDSPKIVHYAAVRNWQKNKRAKWHNYLTKYRKMSWEDALDGNNTHRGSNV